MGSVLGPTLGNVFICHFFPDDSLIHFYSFEERIMLKSLKIISGNNMKTFISGIEEIVHSHFWI